MIIPTAYATNIGGFRVASLYEAPELQFLIASPGNRIEKQRGFLEMAYRRARRAPSPDLQYFPVAQWKPDHDASKALDPVHEHKRVAQSMVSLGVLAAHPGNNRSRCQYRISEYGRYYVARRLDDWIGNEAHALECLAGFEALADSLAREGFYILPEPGRSWRTYQGFVSVLTSYRHLYKYRSQGYHSGYRWQKHDRYFYSAGFELDFDWHIDPDELPF
jgi:hypothetical protein